MGYAERAYAQGYLAAEAVDTVRAAFIRRTYLHVFGAVLAFMGLEAIFLNTPAIHEPLLNAMAGNWWAVLIAFMVVQWVANWWAHSETSPGIQYIGLALYVVAEAVIFVPILFIAHNFGSENLIPTAGIVTFLIFGGLTTAVFMTGKDFSFLRNVLILASLAAMALVVASVFIGFSLGLTFIVAMIALMCGYILYDTSNILYHYRTDQHVAASLALFSAVATLFWYVLRLFMELEE